MGSFRASFEFAGKEFDVLHTEYILNRNTDAKGKPS
ncbi:type VI secretion system tube protein TssD, partial [Tenacibaculum sp.]